MIFISPSNFVFLLLASHTVGHQQQTLLQVSVSFSQAEWYLLQELLNWGGRQSPEIKNKELQVRNESEISNQKWDHRLDYHSRWFKHTQQGVTAPCRVCLKPEYRHCSQDWCVFSIDPCRASWRHPSWTYRSWLQFGFQQHDWTGPTRLVQGRYQVWQGV